MKYCCEKFKKSTNAVNELAGGGSMYPPEMQPNAQIEPDKTRESWNVNGCCGGGCHVLTDVKYCPFCGEELEL